MEGPPPADPAVLDGGADAGGSAQQAVRAAVQRTLKPVLIVATHPQQPPPVPKESRPTPTTSAPPPRPGQAASRHPLLSSAPPAPRASTKPAPQVDLLNADFADSFPPAPQTTAPAQSAAPPTLAPAVGSAQAASTPTAPPAPAPGAGLFDLDFRPPSHSQARPASKKSDIMSLFSSAPPANVPPPQLSPGIQGGGYAGWGAPAPSQAPTSAPQQTSFEGFGAQQQQRQGDSELSAGMGGLSMGGNVWDTPAVSCGQTRSGIQILIRRCGEQHSASSAPQHNSTPAYSYQQPAAPAPSTNHFFSTQDVWGAPVGGAGASSGFSPPALGVNGKSEVKDPFGDIWK